MTNSPPLKVKVNHSISPDVLASGIDSLYLAFDIEWQDEKFFEHLAVMKELAEQDDKDSAITLKYGSELNVWICAIKPHGTKGYEWILSGNEFTMTIGQWLVPKSRPSIMVQVFSETLWRLGPLNAVELLKSIFKTQGAQIRTIKPSRVDLCMDILLPENLWSMDLIQYQVSRAKYVDPHLFNSTFTGISIGRGKIMARLYDKALEIAQRSKKVWMFDVWGIPEVPEGFKIIRIEFQLRREIIKDLGIREFENLIPVIDYLWGYCTDWLQFRDNPGAHHTQRNIFMWWLTVQNSFLGVQEPTPLIRCKAINKKRDQLFAQAYGILTSLEALNCEEGMLATGQDVSLEEALNRLGRYATTRDVTDFKFGVDVLDKRAKYHKAVQKMDEVRKLRQQLGHPSNLPIEGDK